MKLQKGKFLIKNIDELENGVIDNNGKNKIIDLEYMGQFEYEGNAIPISRMFIEYYKEEYCFYPTGILNKEGHQMYVFANSNLVNERIKQNPDFLIDLSRFNINQNYSLWEYINKMPKECLYDFWWNIEGDYFILFGERNKEIISLFINEGYKYDGGKEEIKTKLLKIGYKI
jgi:hypothetical protein